MVNELKRVSLKLQKQSLNVKKAQPLKFFYSWTNPVLQKELKRSVNAEEAGEYMISEDVGVLPIERTRRQANTITAIARGESMTSQYVFQSGVWVL